jgi:hypothetical protein
MSMYRQLALRMNSVLLPCVPFPWVGDLDPITVWMGGPIAQRTGGRAPIWRMHSDDLRPRVAGMAAV